MQRKTISLLLCLLMSTSVLMAQVKTFNDVCPNCGHVSVKGDVNHDGHVTAADLSSVIPLLLGQPLITATSLTLSSTSLNVQKGGGVALVATILPANADVQTVTWGSSNPSVATVTDGTVKGLKAGTAIITASTIDGSNLSAQCSVTVSEVVSNEFNGHQYVDLGLPSGTVWATENVGASKPSDVGKYYAWGEKTTKTAYTWATYSYGTSATTLTKYCTSASTGTVDGKTSLETADDVATSTWGSAWSIPTVTQFNELKANCTVTAFTQDGVAGWKFVSNINGNSIFLPANGYINNAAVTTATRAYYWTREVASTCTKASAFSINGTAASIATPFRYFGVNVRPVAKKS